jgi:hypothetical protein
MLIIHTAFRMHRAPTTYSERMTGGNDESWQPKRTVSFAPSNPQEMVVALFPSKSAAKKKKKTAAVLNTKDNLARVARHAGIIRARRAAVTATTAFEAERRRRELAEAELEKFRNDRDLGAESDAVWAAFALVSPPSSPPSMCVELEKKIAEREKKIAELEDKIIQLRKKNSNLLSTVTQLEEETSEPAVADVPMEVAVVTGPIDLIDFGNIVVPEGPQQIEYEMGAVVACVFSMRGGANETFIGSIYGQKGNQFDVGWFGRLVSGANVVHDPSHETVNLPRSLHRSFDYMISDPSTLDVGSWCIVTE